MIGLYLLAAVGYGMALICLAIVAGCLLSLVTPRVRFISTHGEKVSDMIKGYSVSAFVIIAATHWLTGV